MSGAERDYKFGNKNNWRRWLWNRIRERLSIPPSEATVVYLAGAQNLDAEEAIRRGFRRENLIAIDKDQDIVRQLRQNGSLALQADITIAAWAINRPVHVLLMDFCSGLEAHIADYAHALLAKKTLWNCVVATNLLRGRDASSTRLRQAFSECGKHRSEILRTEMFLQLQRYIARRIWNPDKPSEERDQFYAQFWKKFNGTVAISSYKSGPQYFDSSVYLNPMANFVRSEPDFFNGLQGMMAITDEIEPIRKRLAALLARRTMQFGATSPRAISDPSVPSGVHVDHKQRIVFFDRPDAKFHLTNSSNNSEGW